MGSIDRRLRELEYAWHGDDGVVLEQLDGSVRVFRPWECWAARFTANLELSLKKPEGDVFGALRGATDESREEFFSEYGHLTSAVVSRTDGGEMWAEEYWFDLDAGEVLSIYHPPGSEEAHANFEAA